MKARIAAANQVHSLCDTAPEQIRAQLRPLTFRQKIATIERWRPRASLTTESASRRALVNVARRWRARRRRESRSSMRLHLLELTSCQVRQALPPRCNRIQPRAAASSSAYNVVTNRSAWTVPSHIRTTPPNLASDLVRRPMGCRSGPLHVMALPGWPGQRLGNGYSSKMVGLSDTLASQQAPTPGHGSARCGPPRSENGSPVDLWHQRGERPG